MNNGCSTKLMMIIAQNECYPRDIFCSWTSFCDLASSNYVIQLLYYVQRLS